MWWLIYFIADFSILHQSSDLWLERTPIRVKCVQWLIPHPIHGLVFGGNLNFGLFFRFKFLYNQSLLLIPLPFKDSPLFIVFFQDHFGGGLAYFQWASGLCTGQVLFLHQPNKLFSFVVVDLLVLPVNVLLWILSLNPAFFSHPFLIRKHYRKSKTLKHNNTQNHKKGGELNLLGKEGLSHNHFRFKTKI